MSDNETINGYAAVDVVLSNVDQQAANVLLDTFNKRAAALGVDVKTAQWAIAMLQAHILARAQMGDAQFHVAAEFATMVKLALPAAMLDVERTLRMFAGQPPNDA